LNRLEVAHGMPLSSRFQDKRREALYTSGVVGGRTTHVGYVNED